MVVARQGARYGESGQRVESARNSWLPKTSAVLVPSLLIIRVKETTGVKEDGSVLSRKI